MYAAKNGHPGTVQALIDRGANINQGTTDTALKRPLTATPKRYRR